MLWKRMGILIFLLNSTDITFESFVQNSRQKETRERGAAKKETEYLYKSLRSPNKPPIQPAVDLSSGLTLHSKSPLTLTHLKVTPEPFMDNDDDASNREGFGYYEDMSYNSGEYPQHDDTPQKERDDNFLHSSSSNEIGKLSIESAASAVAETESIASSSGESEVSRSSRFISKEDVKGGKLSEGNLLQSPSLHDDEFQRDKRLENEETQNSEQEEKLLLQKLMVGYERDVRPVRNASDPVVIRVGITLTQIFDMDEKQQVLTTNVWLDQEWNDEMLRWDPEDYGGLKTIRLPCDRIWLPDIVLYNNADDYTRGYMPSRAMVSYDGNVFWPPPTKFRSTCSVDVTYFPFDNQICFLKLGSWTYNGFQVDVTNRTSAVDLSNYIQNGEWELVKAVQQRNVVYYSCCPEPFPDVTVTLVIQRKTLYYIYNIVLPCIMLSALTLLVFCLPPDSGEKIALGITVLLAFSVFMLAINESLPETSESIPLIGVYLTIVMAITSVSVIMTVVVLNLHYLGPKVRPVPTWLTCLLSKENRSQIRQRSLLLPMAQREPKSGSLKRNHVVITAHRSGNGEETYSLEVAKETLENMGIKDVVDGSSESNTNENTGNYSNNTRRTNCSAGTSSQSMASSHSQQRPADGQLVMMRQRQASQQNAISLANNLEESRGKDTEQTEVMTELLSSIKLLIQKQEDIEAQNNLVAEWRLVAQEVDRILFWIFFIFTVTSSTIILLILPVYQRGGFAFLGLDSNSSYSSGIIITE